MIKFKRSDIDREFARLAYRGTSMFYEDRGDQVINEYIAEMEARSTEFTQYAKEVPANLENIKNDLERYRVKYLKMTNDILSAQSRVMSSFITGPSNFPTNSNRKKNNTLDKRIKEFLDWHEKALRRLRLDYNPTLIAQRPIRSDEDDAIAQLEEKIKVLEQNQEWMKGVNKIVRSKKLDQPAKVEAIKALGVHDDLIKDLGRYESGKFPGFKLTNNNANIKRCKERLVSLQAEAEREEVEDRTATIQGSAVTISENYEETRLQLFFDGKPPKEIIKLLKQNGFKFARSQGNAWQRLLNNNARRTIDYIID